MQADKIFKIQPDIKEMYLNLFDENVGRIISGTAVELLNPRGR